MPDIGGRTPVTNAIRSAGGVCWEGGADEAGKIESLEERVLKLEKALALILGQDVETGQLSNISGQIGWVHGVTYLGQEGWTKTQYGSLIPPPGVSLSDLGFDFTFGGRWQLVTTNEDGELVFGLSSTGAVGGTKVDQWDSTVSGITTVTWTDIDVASVVGQVDFTAVETDTLGSALSWDAGTPKRLTIESDGWYMFNVHMSGTLRATVSNSSRGFSVSIHDSASSTLHTFGDMKMQDKTTGTGTAVTTRYNASTIFYCNSGDYVMLSPILFTPDSCSGRLTGVKIANAGA